jgi:hypothetical protein
LPLRHRHLRRLSRRVSRPSASRETELILADGSPEMPSDVQGFGQSLLHAIQAMLTRGHRSAVVLNADSPTLPTALPVRTAATLAANGNRAVLAPTDDGGNYLLSMKVPYAHLFSDRTWSTDRVAETTKARAATLGLEVIELPTWYDVNDQAALTRLLEETAMPRPDTELLPYAPHTTLALTRVRARDLDLAAE